jgi:2-phospho-L-lactate guanylyltransferase
VDAHGWSAVVPVKRPAYAKQRLADYGDWRPVLAAAFAADVISALHGSDDIREVIVVGGEGLAARVLTAPRLRKIADVRGLNEAVNAGLAAAHRAGAAGVLVVPADLPCLRSSDVDLLIQQADGDRASVLADADGDGTAALLIPSPVRFSPAFGPGSFGRHLRQGAHALNGDLATARRDVDTVEHLVAARQLGVGQHTARVLALLEASAQAIAPITAPDHNATIETARTAVPSTSTYTR